MLTYPPYPPTSSVRIVPKNDIANTPDIALDELGLTGGVLPDVIDMRILIEGLSSTQAATDMDALRTASRSGKLSRELSATPGLKAASVGSTPDSW